MQFRCSLILSTGAGRRSQRLVRQGADRKAAIVRPPTIMKKRPLFLGSCAVPKKAGTHTPRERYALTDFHRNTYIPGGLLAMALGFRL